METKVLNFGSLNLDYVYSVDHFVQEGETLSSVERNTFCGGKGLNQSVALAKSGCKVFHAGAVGKDDSGILLDMLDSAGVNREYLRFKDGPTGHAIIQKNKAGNNCILLFGGANQEILRQDIDETFSHFGKGDFLILQNEINELSYIIEKGHERGMEIVLNPSPMNERIETLPLDMVDYFMLNEVEAAGITGVDVKDSEGLISALREKFPQAHVVLTLGERGSVYAFKDTVIKQGIFKVMAVDTTAAGDTFTGFFIGALIHGEAPEKALEIAAKASAIAVSRPGAAPSIPELTEVKSRKLVTV